MAYYQPYQPQYYTQMAAQYNPMQQPYIQPQTAQNQPQANQNGLIWVQGIEAAKSYLVAPNNTVLLMDSESPKFYLKTSDASGMPLPLRVFEYQETAVNGPNKVPESSTVDLSAYATKAEFDAFKSEINGVLKNVPRQVTRRSEREEKSDG